jgi:hypothetical protein
VTGKELVDVLDAPPEARDHDFGMAWSTGDHAGAVAADRIAAFAEVGRR